MLGISLCAQTADPQSSQPPASQPASSQTTTAQPAQPPAGSRAQTIRQMVQAEAARRAAANAAAQGQTPAVPVPAPAAPVPTQAVSASPVPAQSTAPQPAQPAAVPAAVPVPAQPAALPTTPAAPPAVSSAQPPAAVKSVKVVHDKVAGSAIEIVTSHPVPPALQTLGNPPRLVIDLPNANVAVKKNELPAKGGQFTDIRIEQLQISPPVTRVTVALVEALQYTWDGAGNRLTIRLKPPDDPKAKATPPPPAQPDTVSTFGSAAQPAVVPVASRPTGSAVIAGSRIGNGSSITASTETAVLHIARGGELHVCPGSTVSVTASKSNQDLMFGMSTGTLETHYHLGTASDAVLTPDFRILLSGPGDFDYAISANSHGDTCIRALLGNTAPLTVSELMGDRSYQVKPTEQVVFHEGRIDRLSNDVPFDCGCASPPPPVMRASVPATTTTTVAEANLPPNLHLPSANTATRAALDPMLPPLANASRPAIAGPAGSQTGMALARPETAPLPPSKPADIHVQIEAPLVFRGGDRPKATTQTASNMPPPVPPRAQPRNDPAAPVPQPAPAPKPAAQEEPNPKEHRGFFGKVKGFFSAVFH